MTKARAAIQIGWSFLACSILVGGLQIADVQPFEGWDGVAIQIAFEVISFFLLLFGSIIEKRNRRSNNELPR